MNTNAMWLMLFACVALVTVLARFFGLKALVMVVALCLVTLLVMERTFGNYGDDKS